MKLIQVASIAVLSTLTASGLHAQAYTINFSQAGGGSGSISAFDMSGSGYTLADLYNYTGTGADKWSYRGNLLGLGLPTAPTKTVTSFFVFDGTNLGYFDVYGADTTSRNATSVLTSDSPIGLALEDDTSDTYAIAYSSGVYTLTAHNTWGTPYTDGFVLDGFAGDTYLTQKFSSLSTPGFSWKLLSADDPATTLTLGTGASHMVTFDIHPAPEPASIAIVGVLGLGAILALRRRKARAS